MKIKIKKLSYFVLSYSPYIFFRQLFHYGKKVSISTAIGFYVIFTEEEWLFIVASLFFFLNKKLTSLNFVWD